MGEADENPGLANNSHSCGGGRSLQKASIHSPFALKLFDYGHYACAVIAMTLQAMEKLRLARASDGDGQ